MLYKDLIRTIAELESEWLVSASEYKRAIERNDAAATNFFFGKCCGLYSAIELLRNITFGENKDGENQND